MVRVREERAAKQYRGVVSNDGRTSELLQSAAELLHVDAREMLRNEGVFVTFGLGPLLVDAESVLEHLQLRK
jgi:hypothetical protein